MTEIHVPDAPLIEGLHFRTFEGNGDLADMARVMNVIGDWQWRPLYRFQRSLEKRHRNRKLHFDDDDWQALMDGYQS